MKKVMTIAIAVSAALTALPAPTPGLGDSYAAFRQYAGRDAVQGRQGCWEWVWLEGRTVIDLKVWFSADIAMAICLGFDQDIPPDENTRIGAITKLSNHQGWERFDVPGVTGQGYKSTDGKLVAVINDGRPAIITVGETAKTGTSFSNFLQNE